MCGGFFCWRTSLPRFQYHSDLPIPSSSVWSKFGTGDSSQQQRQPLPTQQSSLQTPALGKSPKDTHQQVTACDSCVRFWVPCSSTQSIKRQHSRCNPPEQRSCSKSPSCTLVSHRSPGSPPGPRSVVVPSAPMCLSAVGATCTWTPASRISFHHSWPG